MKRNFSAMTIEDAMQALQQTYLRRWQPPSGPYLPSVFLTEALRRLHAFDLQTSEAAKILLIDVVLAEIVPQHPLLKVWKSAPLESETLTGVADYVIAPNFSFASPLLCLAQAVKDDFVQGSAECLAHIAACVENNIHERTEIYGIVSNGEIWQFYKWQGSGNLYESKRYSLLNLKALLGALDYICRRCTYYYADHNKYNVYPNHLQNNALVDAEPYLREPSIRASRALLTDQQLRNFLYAIDHESKEYGQQHLADDPLNLLNSGRSLDHIFYDGDESGPVLYVNEVSETRYLIHFGFVYRVEGLPTEAEGGVWIVEFNEDETVGEFTNHHLYRT